MSVTLTGPVGTATIAGVDGQVDALGKLRLDELVGVNRDHIELGIDDGTGTLYIGATSLTALAGSATTRSSENVIRADLASTPVAVCTTGLLSHTGLRKIRCRMYADEADTAVRMEHRIGDGRWTSGKWVYPVLDQISDLALGEISVPEGKQFEIRIVAKNPTTAGADFDVMAVMPFPGLHYAVMSSPVVVDLSPTAFSARSGFDTESGAITGDSLATGGTWTGAGDADDFSVAGGVATRTAVSDASALISTGRIITASTPTLAAVGASVDFKSSAGGDDWGLILRYTDINNFLAVYVESGDPALYILKRVSGSDTVLKRGPVVPTAYTLANTWYTIKATADANGNVMGQIVGFDPIYANDPVLATGGALASGKVGIVDHHSGATAITRTYDNFAAWVLETNAVLFANRYLEHRWDGSERQKSSGGAVLGRVPDLIGKHLFIPPAGRESKTYRLAVKANRNNVDEGLPANSFATLGDTMRATLDVRGRVLLVGVSNPGS